MEPIDFSWELKPGWQAADRDRMVLIEWELGNVSTKRMVEIFKRITISPKNLVSKN